MNVLHRAVTGAAVLAAVLLPSAPATADAPVPVPDGSTITITGDGYGHGVGLSQYGAYGAARKGLGFKQILRFYYPGTKLGAARGKLKVRIMADDGKVVVDDQPGLRARSLASGKTFRLLANPAKQWRIRPAGSGRSEIAYKTRAWHVLRVVKGDAEIFGGAEPLALRVSGTRIEYRGALRSASYAGGRVTVNVLPLEDYVRGVVASEVPASIWPQQALRAQAVAARAYATFERRYTNREAYDLCDDASCQVYGGVAAEWPTADEAVARTAHQVVTYHGGVAFAQFSASNGGWTVANPDYPYLRAQEDPYEGTSGDYCEWSHRLTDADLEAQWPVVGDLESVTIDVRDGKDRVSSRGGRVLSLVLTGSGGSVPVDGEVFQRRFGLLSTLFEVTDEG